MIARQPGHFELRTLAWPVPLHSVPTLCEEMDIDIAQIPFAFSFFPGLPRNGALSLSLMVEWKPG